MNKEQKRLAVLEHNAKYDARTVVEATLVPSPEHITKPEPLHDILIVGDGEATALGKRDAQEVIAYLKARGDVGVTPMGRSLRNKMLIAGLVTGLHKGHH